MSLAIVIFFKTQDIDLFHSHLQHWTSHVHTQYDYLRPRWQPSGEVTMTCKWPWYTSWIDCFMRWSGMPWSFSTFLWGFLHASLCNSPQSERSKGWGQETRLANTCPLTKSFQTKLAHCLRNAQNTLQLRDTCSTRISLSYPRLHQILEYSLAPNLGTRITEYTRGESDARSVISACTLASWWISIILLGNSRGRTSAVTQGKLTLIG